MKAITWQGTKLQLLDQTLLPGKQISLELTKYEQVAEAIKTMKVRGAPAIGIAAAYGLVLASKVYRGNNRNIFREYLQEAKKILAATRPTAVNLFWALERMEKVWNDNADKNFEELIELLEQEAEAIEREDLEGNKRMGLYGSELVPQGANILTHCNAGALAVSGYGTALGIVRAAHEQGKVQEVYADETRPLLQGARLTAWELLEDGIPVTLITDNMAAYLMKLGKVDLVIVGADRITAQGDVANKIGTYGLAILANYHGIPFYVAAPSSTIDMSLELGEQIPIEEREHDEVRRIGGVLIAPEGVRVFNPAFDVTPAKLVTAIITEFGVLKPPFAPALHEIFNRASK